MRTPTTGNGHDKLNDKDVIYDERLVLPYTLPPLLVTAEGEVVTTAEEWMNNRRPQILSLFANLIYGRVPLSQEPVKTSYQVIRRIPGFMRGMATRLIVSMDFENSEGKISSVLQVYVPNNARRPVPALMIYTFSDTQSHEFDEDPDQPGLIQARWPLGIVLEQGYAVVVVDSEDAVGYNEIRFCKDALPYLFYDNGQSHPRAHEWGVISTIAWTGSRALDYLETLESVDHERVGIIGHSKLGKAALWTGAQDQRFAVVFSVQSGAGGAALWRRRYGETLGKMVTNFPYWLSRNAWKFVGREDDLPVDQHMLLALVAPRPLYVASAADDHWSDPRGEYLSAWHASKVYHLFGLEGLTSEESPPLDQPMMNGAVGYHVRTGGHILNEYDLDRILEFSNRHLMSE